MTICYQWNEEKPFFCLGNLGDLGDFGDFRDFRLFCKFYVNLGFTIKIPKNLGNFGYRLKFFLESFE